MSYLQGFDNVTELVVNPLNGGFFNFEMVKLYIIIYTGIYNTNCVVMSLDAVLSRDSYFSYQRQCFIVKLVILASLDLLLVDDKTQRGDSPPTWTQ